MRNAWFLVGLCIAIALVCAGLALLRSAATGIRCGELQQHNKPWAEPLENIQRTNEPVRFWLLIGLNAVLGLLFVGGGLWWLALMAFGL